MDNVDLTAGQSTCYVLNQRRQYAELSITQCQIGIDDLADIPPELYKAEHLKLGLKGSTGVYVYCGLVCR